MFGVTPQGRPWERARGAQPAPATFPETPREARKTPSGSQERPKSDKERAKRGQERPKSGQERPRAAQEPSEAHLGGILARFGTFLESKIMVFP